MNSELKSLQESTNLGEPKHTNSSAMPSGSSPSGAALEPGRNTDGDKSNFCQIEVLGEFDSVEAIAKTKKLRWAVRRRFETEDAKNLIGIVEDVFINGKKKTLANGSVLEAAVRPHGGKSVVRIWFNHTNRNLKPEDVRYLEKWLKVTKDALKRGWSALDEEPT